MIYNRLVKIFLFNCFFLSIPFLGFSNNDSTCFLFYIQEKSNNSIDSVLLQTVLDSIQDSKNIKLFVINKSYIKLISEKSISNNFDSIHNEINAYSAVNRFEIDLDYINQKTILEGYFSSINSINNATANKFVFVVDTFDSRRLFSSDCDLFDLINSIKLISLSEMCSKSDCFFKNNSKEVIDKSLIENYNKTYNINLHAL